MIHECGICGYKWDCGDPDCENSYLVPQANCENHGGSRPRFWDSL